MAIRAVPSVHKRTPNVNLAFQALKLANQTLSALSLFSANKSTFARLSSDADFQEAERHSYEQPIVLFKHSRTCPVSAWARDKMLMLADKGSVPVYELIVQNARSLAVSIASAYGIRHESPQVIVLYAGEPVHHASHSGISPQEIEAAAASAVDGRP